MFFYLRDMALLTIDNHKTESGNAREVGFPEEDSHRKPAPLPPCPPSLKTNKQMQRHVGGIQGSRHTLSLLLTWSENVRAYLNPISGNARSPGEPAGPLGGASPMACAHLSGRPGTGHTC